jgi:tetratricopeptide (TPR) repeat protein
MPSLAERALDLVMADPKRASETARVVLSTRSADAVQQVTARRALGLATRELQDAAGAAAHLRRAVALATRHGLDGPAAEARMSLALVLDDLGRPAEALRAIEEALAALTGLPQARARMQQAIILRRMGREPEALAGYRAALAAFRRHGDEIWQARALTNRGVLHAYQGNFTLAQSDLRGAERLYRAQGRAAAVAQVQHNLGFVAAQAGDVPAALGLYDQADGYFRRNGSPAAALIDRAELLLSAALLPEAAQMAGAAVTAAARARLSTLLAQSRLLVARVALAAGDQAEASRAARSARRAFHRQGRANWAELGRYAEALADPTHRRVRLAAAALETTGWAVPAWDAWLDAAELAVRAGDLAAARDDLARAHVARRRGAVRQRARAWHVDALVRLAEGDRAGAKRAAAAGLREVDAYRASLGATELRIRGGTEAAELATLRLRMALQEGRPREALTWVQRWRAGALRLPPTRPPAAAVAAPLAELRRIGAELSAVPTDQRRTARLLRRQRVLEEEIRNSAWRVPGTGAPVRPAVPFDALVAALDQWALVEIVAVDGELHALVVVDGRVRHRGLGPLSAVGDEVHALRFALRRLVLVQGSRPAAQAALAHSVHLLNDRLLAPLSGLIAGRPLILAPTGVLHALPWAMLPACSGRPLVVTPSATLWHRAATAVPDKTNTTLVLVAGPQPPQAPQEVAALAELRPDAIVLTGGRARTRGVLEALDGAGVAHIATHGEFRADNPLFSHLMLADGPLTVHDLSTLNRAPRMLVLSACDTGLSAVHPGDELMGLSAALLGLGTRTIIASIGPVDDERTSALMVELYRRLGAGAEPAVALADAQAAAPADGRTTTHSFLCLGSGQSAS